MDLAFEVTVREIRDAAGEEIARGHIHHHGGCCGRHGNGCGGENCCQGQGALTGA
jgi:FKBP-type peptidyl-prolyl cis-trans isomerase SlyD